jgi:hypothetical protein
VKRAVLGLAILAGAACYSALAADEPPAIADARGRSDKELLPTYGTCHLGDFRHHSCLTAEAWDALAWQSVGFLHAANDENYRNTFGPRYRLSLEILADGRPQHVTPQHITQQLDCRTTAGTADAVDFQRIDMLVASLQWITAWQCRNTTSKDLEIEFRATLTDDHQLARSILDMAEGHMIVTDTFVSHLLAFDRKPRLVLYKSEMSLAWTATVPAGRECAVCLAIRPGWGQSDVDKARSTAMNYNTCRKLAADELAAAFAAEFPAATAEIGVPGARLTFADMAKLAAAKQQRLARMMPRLCGFPARWHGLWDYTLDLLRAGTKPPQGQCSDVWMTGDPMFYLWTFYWDTALTAHAYGNLDAATASRTLLTFLRTGIRPDGSAWLQFNPVKRYPNDRPQLLNIPLALWDCYQITRDKRCIAEAYPILVRHQEWLDRVWNKRPAGPIADLDWNIDYGCALHQERHIWLDMTTFQVSQYEHLAKMAELLGHNSARVAAWRAKAAELRTAINRYMWNAADGAYYCLKSRNLEQTKVSCPIEFYTLVTGVAAPPQVSRLVQRLVDPAKYAPGGKGRYFCPSVAYDDPSFAIRPHGAGGWGGNIWLVEPYYTVRGLCAYGMQDEAAAVARNLYGMAADEYLRTGSIWEQYNPASGHGIHLKYFTSGIASTIVDMLLRGVLGFQRCDDPAAFYFTPRPAGGQWQGVENLRLAGNVFLDLKARCAGQSIVAKVRVAGPGDSRQRLRVYAVKAAGGAKRLFATVDAREGGNVSLSAERGTRFLWEIVP